MKMTKRTGAALALLGILALWSSVTYAGEAQEIDKASGITAQTLKEILPESLKEHAELFCEMEQEHEVNALFVAAIAQHETQSGTVGTGASKNNLFGNRGRRGYMNFESFEDSIEYEFGLLRRLYFDNGLTSIGSVSKKYCVPPEHWAKSVGSIFETYTEQAEKQGEEAQ